MAVEPKDKGTSEGRWSIASSIIGAIAGIIGGAASVFGVLAAKPDLITIVVPVQTLREVVVAAEARELQQAPGPAATIVETASQPPPAPVVVAQAPLAVAAAAMPLGGNLSVAVASLADTPDQFVATLRFTNDSDVEQLIAVRSNQNGYGGDFNLTDGFGGSCPWASGGIFFGTLRPAQATPQPTGRFERYFSSVPPHGSVVHTLMFQKRRCATPASGEHPMSLSGAFVVIEGDAWRTPAASFEGITAVRPN